MGFVDATAAYDIFPLPLVACCCAATCSVDVGCCLMVLISARRDVMSFLREETVEHKDSTILPMAIRGPIVLL